MAKMRNYFRSFAGGEISPEMFGRIDDQKFQTGAATVRNFITTPTGAGKNRPGFAYVNTTFSNQTARLIPFIYDIDQSMVIELGNHSARFHTNGATLRYPTTGVNAFIGQTTPASSLAFSVGNPCNITWDSHGFANGDLVCFVAGGDSTTDPILAQFQAAGGTVATGGTLPAGISESVIYSVAVVDANTFQIVDPEGNFVRTTSAGSGPLYGYPYYTPGDLATFGGLTYYRAGTTYGAGPSGTDPSTIPQFWLAEPLTGEYQILTPYLPQDLFAIHIAQSADVMTLVHPNYPPMELERLSATTWTLTPIIFGPPLPAPAGVAVSASPGFKALIASITMANPAVITTVANHTLAMGDGVYVAGLTATIGGSPVVLDNFYMVQSVPVDMSGNLIPNELTLMDYNGNTLDSAGWSGYSSGATIQYGTKIFNITNAYAVQAVASDGVSTSALSNSASILNNLDVTGSYNTVTWNAASGAQSYNVYKQLNGLWGFIGNTQALTFADNNIAPDMSVTPGFADPVFSGTGNYPGAVAYFEQRRSFAGTGNAPQNLWMSNTGTESMFSYSLPSQATDRIAVRVAALQADGIRHIVPMTQLILLTSQTEFAQPSNEDPVAPTNVGFKPQSYIGASTVQPTIINTTMVYAAARGGHVREMGYAWTVNGFMTGDLSLRAAHLFDNYAIVDQAYAKAPIPIIWFVSSSGDLLGLTYIPEEQIGAWHHHDTQGTFVSIAVVPEGNEDVLYAVIQRTVGGLPVYYVERMASRIIDPADSSTWFFVDAGISQSFESPVTTVSGLTWLEGQTVAVLADGGLQSPKVVTGGAITLDHAASQVQIGLPYTCDLQTLPLVLQMDGFGQGRNKNINRAWVKVFQSSGIFVGPDVDHLTEIKQRTTEPWGSPPALQTAELEVLTTPEWQQNGQVFIRQQNPLPLEVVGLTMEVVLGD